ncbi:DUF2535 family protein [Neobacillus vireti]|uniref:DUF2535 family protein n=1 Tax=Neobacillus vireti TaxID=220686 RepID=UPI002FFE0A1E
MLLFKSLEFKNQAEQKIKVMEIPVLEASHPHFFMIQTRLQTFVSFIHDNPQQKSCYSFREYLKRKMSWSDFKELYRMEEVNKNKA